MRKISFRWFVTLAMLGVGIFPILVLSSTLVKQAYDSSRNNALRELVLLAGDAAGRAEQEIRLLRSRMELISQNSDMEYAARSLAFVERADSLVSDFATNNPLAHEIWYLSSRSFVIASAPTTVEMLAPPPEVQTTVKSFFIKVAENPLATAITEFERCSTRENQPAICFYHPVIGSTTEILGIVAVQVELAQLLTLTTAAPSPTIVTSLFNNEGELIYGPAQTNADDSMYFRFKSAVTLMPTGQRAEQNSPLLFALELSEPIKERLKHIDKLMLQLAIYIVTVTIAIICISIFMAHRLFAPIKTMTRLVSNYEIGNLAAEPEDIPFSEFQNFMQTLTDLGHRIQEYMQKATADAARESSMKRAIAEAELQALKNQMKPHFLFNALNSVVALISVDAGRAQNLLLKLSELYRLILAQTDRVVIPLEDELAIVENYLALQSVRFESRLKYSVGCDIDPKRVYIPSLALQTLVENALKHGIEPYREGGKVIVRIKRSPAGSQLPYLVEVVNTGLPLAKPRSEGKGLENTKRRLRLIDGDAHNLTIESTTEGTRVAFSFSGRPYDQDSHS
jgi:sensor histidine kinase YesM